MGTDLYFGQLPAVQYLLICIYPSRFAHGSQRFLMPLPQPPFVEGYSTAACLPFATRDERTMRPRLHRAPASKPPVSPSILFYASCLLFPPHMLAYRAMFHDTLSQ